MAIKAFEIYGDITANVSPLQKSLAEAQSRTQRFATGLQSFGKSMSQMGSRLTVGLTLPLVGFGIKSVSAFEEAQRAANQTQAVLKSTGNAANVTRASMDRLTKSIGNQASVDDDLIRQGANMLLTFTSIRNEAGVGNDIFDQSVTVLTDLAAAMASASGGEMDLKGSAIQLGKALNDPVKGIMSLTRVGVQFTAQQKDQIETLAKSGDMLGAQKLILAELTREFGGSAKANATSSMKLKKSLDDLAESVGELVIPFVKNLTDLANKLTQAFRSLSPEMQKTVVRIAAFSAAAGPIMKLVGPLLSVAGAFARIAATARAASVATAAISGAGAIAAAGPATVGSLGWAMPSAAAGGKVAANGAAAAGGAALLNPVTAAIVALTAAILGALKAHSDYKKSVDNNVTRLQEHGGLISKLTLANAGLEVSTNDLSGGQRTLEDTIKQYREKQLKLTESLAFATSKMRDYTNSVLQNILLSDKESEKVAYLISGIDRMGGSFDMLLLKQAENLLAQDDLTGALKKLREAANQAAMYLKNVAPATVDPRTGIDQSFIRNRDATTSTTKIQITFDRKVFSRQQEYLVRASGF